MLRVDQVLHQRYRIVRQLGHGGMGTVYVAIDEKFGAPVAIKEVVLASSNDRQWSHVARAFENEAMALAKAQHEAIPYVRDYFSEFDRQYLVMELVEGDDLAAMMTERQGPFPLADCLKWLDQLLDALDYLHNLEPPIIHRDIKPQNLKLNRRGRVKLLDFGIATSIDGGAHTITGQTFVGATMDYSPVEQILRTIAPTFREYILLQHKERAERVLAQSTDARCDLYSLGAALYHLMTGEVPADAVKRMLETWEGRPDPLADPSTVNAAIPPGISAVLMKAMAIDRDDRFTTALAMQTALHTAISQDKFLQDSVFSGSWGNRHLQVAGVDESRLLEQQLMQAQTVKLLANNYGEVRISSSNTPLIGGLPTEKLAGSPPEQYDDWAKFDAFEPSPTEPFYGGSAAGDSAEGWQQIEDREPEASERLPSEGRNTVAYEVRQAAPARTVGAKRPSVYWIFPAAAAMLFLISGIGAAFWVYSDSLGRSGGVYEDNDEANPTPTPEVTPSPTPSRLIIANPTPTPKATPVRTPTPKPAATLSKTPSPTPTPTPVRAPKPTPRPTPINTPRPTPKPTPIKIQRPTPRPQKTADPNCIYTNSCGY